MRKIIICCLILSSNLFFSQKKIEQIPKPESSKKTRSKAIEDKKNEDKVQAALTNLLKENKKSDTILSRNSNNQTSSNGIKNSNGHSVGREIGVGTGSGNGGGNSYGNGNYNGKGIGLGFSLVGRKALTTPKPENNCGNEYGTIVVKITVDKNGNAIDASPGYRGTTNSNSCLLNEAKKAALKTRWEPSSDGTEKQVGTIIYNFGIQN